MAPLAFQRGFRTFTIASLLAALIGILHTAGLANDPPNDTWAKAYDAARAATLDTGPFSMSLYGTFVGVWIQVGALLVMLGVKNVLLVSILRAENSSGIVRRMAMFDCAGFAVLTALFLYFRIPPPLMSFALLTVLFGIAAFLSGRSKSKLDGASPA